MPGDWVQWETTDGQERTGRLRSWRGLTAVIETDDGEVVYV